MGFLIRGKWQMACCTAGSPHVFANSLFLLAIHCYVCVELTLPLCFTRRRFQVALEMARQLSQRVRFPARVVLPSRLAIVDVQMFLFLPRCAVQPSTTVAASHPVRRILGLPVLIFYALFFFCVVIGWPTISQSFLGAQNHFLTTNVNNISACTSSSSFARLAGTSFDGLFGETLFCMHKNLVRGIM